MIEAHIFFNDVEVSVRAIDTRYPPDTIRELAAAPLDALGRWDLNTISDVAMRQQIWIYTLRNQIGPFSFRYDFNAAQSDVNFAKPMGRILDFGFDDAEPTAEVNLDKLTAKLRDNLKTRELLIKYYNS